MLLLKSQSLQNIQRKLFYGKNAFKIVYKIIIDIILPVEINIYIHKDLYIYVREIRTNRRVFNSVPAEIRTEPVFRNHGIK